MSGELSLLVDETGTGGNLLVQDKGDFGIGAILVDDATSDRLHIASQQIMRLTASDYKYRHVKKKDDARQVFLNAINGLQKPLGVFGLYAMSGGLLNERVRALAAMTKFGSDPRDVSETVDAIENGDSAKHLGVFLKFFVPCVIRYAASLKTKVRVFWDQRSDLDRIMAHCDSERANYKTDPLYGDISDLVSFEGAAEGKFKSAAMLAGVVAGDIRAAFNRHSKTIEDALLEHPLETASDYYRELYDGKIEFEEFLELMLVQRFSLPFGASKAPEPMLDFYRHRFFDSTVSLVWGNGNPCHIVFKEESDWNLYRFPD